MTYPRVQVFQPCLLPDTGDTHYDPCTHGLHVCGQFENHFYTVCNIPLPKKHARAVFEAMKNTLGELEDADFTVDLQMDGDHLEDFQMHRQMLNRLILQTQR
jgi:hypothetical protein